MKSVILLLLVVVSVLSCVQLTSAASITSISFYSDANCTQAVNASQVAGATSSYTQWTSLPSNGVYDLQSPPCFNDTIPGVQSGTYECLSNTNPGGLLVYEYSQPNCGGAPSQIFEFLGPVNATCFSGFIQVPPSAPTNLYAAVTCSNTTATAVVASSTGAMVSASSSPVVPPMTASLCIILYSLPGNVDYPFSIAESVTIQYTPTPVTTRYGTAVTVLSATGTRVYTNRFGISVPTPFTLAKLGSSGSNNLLYLNSALPFDTNGLTWNFTANPIQTPGHGPLALSTTLGIYNTSNAILEARSARIDPLGSAFLSSVPGFNNITIGASNINSLAAQYSTCTAPISCQ